MLNKDKYNLRSWVFKILDGYLVVCYKLCNCNKWFYDTHHNTMLNDIIWRTKTLLYLSITMTELGSYIIEAINQLRSSKKQPNENTIFNLLLEKLEAIAINKEQLTERLNYLVEIKVLQNKPRNGVNSFYITNNESESSESPLIQTCPDR